MSNIRTLGKDTLVYGLGSVFKKFIGVILLPFYTRALSPSDYGILDTLATVIFFISAIIGLGLEGGTGRYFFIAETDVEKGKVLYTSVMIRNVTNWVPILLLLPFSNKISNLLFDSSNYNWVVAISLLTIPLTNTTSLQDLLFRYYREVWKYTHIVILRAILNPILGILLVVVFQLGVLGATLSTFISTLITLIVAYFYYARKKYIRQFSWVWAKKMLVFGFPLIFTSLLVWVNSVSDRFFLLHYSTLDSIGLYSIGNIFSQPILLINMAISMSSTVLIMSLYSEEKTDEKPKTKVFLTKIWNTYLAIAIPGAVCISIFSYDLVKFVTTPAYVGGILALPSFLFSHVLSMSSNVTGNGMTLKEQSKPYVWIMLIAAGTNFGLNFYFVPNFGFVGAAITTIISNIIYFLISYYWSQKVFYIKRSFIKPALLFLIGLSVAIFFPSYELKIGGHISYFIKTAVLITVLILPFLFKIVDPQQIGDLISKAKQKIKSE